MSYDAKTARMHSAEAKAQAEAYAMENAQPLLDFLYAEIQVIAARGGERYFKWLDETQETVWLRSSCGSGKTSQVALMGHVLLENPAGPDGARPTLLGRALLKHLHEAGYKAYLNTFPGGQLVIDWSTGADEVPA